MQCHLGDAGIFNVELVRFRQWQLQQYGQDHPNDASMAEDGHVLAWMPLKNLSDTGFHAFAENLSTLTIGHAMMMNLLQPLVGFEFELFFNFLPAKTRPVAKIDLAQPVQDGLVVAV